MKKSKYTKSSALNKVLKHSINKGLIIKNDLGYIIDILYRIKNGSVGNGVLGAISFLKHTCNMNIKVIDERQFNLFKGSEGR